MDFENLKGTMTIGRPFGPGIPREGRVDIELHDEISGTRIALVRLSLPEFAQLLTGHNAEVEYDLNAEHAGQRGEYKEELIFVPNRPVAERDYVAAAALAPFEVDGWSGFDDDCFNSHRATKIGEDARNNQGGWVYRVRFFRWLPRENTLSQEDGHGQG